MKNKIFPFYNNLMSNWNYFVNKKNKKKIPKTLGIVNWHLIKNFGLINIKKFIKDNFSVQQRKKITLLDIGCNDGYLTEHLARLGFKKVIGVEPRNETILKGKKIRKFLKIKTKAYYKKLSINQLKRLKSLFHITVCSGVLHHTDNFFLNLKKILSVTKKYFILEGEFIPDSQLNRGGGIYKIAQLKDPIYNLKRNSNLCGITIEKLESSYANGSTLKSGIVQTVSIESVKMYAKILGYNLIIYKKKLFKNSLNSFRGVLIFSKLEKDDDKIDSNLQNEIIFFKTILPRDIIYKLKAKISIKKTIKKKFFNIIKTITISPKDKILLETAKFYISQKNTKEAYAILTKILKRRSGDWFSQYRALYLLYLIDIKNFQKRLKWKKLLIESNYYFPRKLFDRNFVKKHFNNIL